MAVKAATVRPNVQPTLSVLLDLCALINARSVQTIMGLPLLQLVTLGTSARVATPDNHGQLAPSLVSACTPCAAGYLSISTCRAYLTHALC